MVGIYGLGGIGKTTIAKAIYNSIADQFEGICFLADVREISKREDGLVLLQETLLHEILKDPLLKVGNVHRGINVIKDRLCCKKILLVLDDVDQLEQLEKLVGERDWFGLGSRIIITTRDLNLLVNHKVDSPPYKVDELDDDKALRLFSWHAFESDKPIDGYVELAKQATQYAQGLPLALVVLGSHLKGNSIQEWRSALNRYQDSPHEGIQNVLRISYDGLNGNEKNIFLDIACFFKGKNAEYVSEILESCGFYPDHGIKVLMDKSLITIRRCNELGMHDLLQDMGREIVRQESPDPGERSRLWSHEDIRRVLEENTVTNKIEGMLIDFPKRDVIDLSSKAFKKMKRLRVFINHNARFSRAPNYLSNELRVFDWVGYPMTSLPSNFKGNKLVRFEMRDSYIKELGNGYKNFQSLTIMKFTNCQFLKEIPDLSGSANLKRLEVDSCENLVKVHPSVGFLEKLVTLEFAKCHNLRSFPRSVMLRSLEILSLFECPNLQNFPEIKCEMKCLRFLILHNTAIKELPPSIGYLTWVRFLRLDDCKDLMHLPSNVLELQHLESLSLRNCSNQLLEFTKDVRDKRKYMPSSTNSTISNEDLFLRLFPSLNDLDLENSILSRLDLSKMSNLFDTLTKLNLSGSDFVRLPAYIERLVGLSILVLNNCKLLQEIIALPPNISFIDADGCTSLESFPEVSKTLQLEKSDVPGEYAINLSRCNKMCANIENHLENPLLDKGHLMDHRFSIVCPGTKIPDWFAHCKEASNGYSCKVDVNGLCLDEIRGVAFCAVFAVFGPPRVTGRQIIGIGVYVNNREIKNSFCVAIDAPPGFDSDHVWLGCCVDMSCLKGDSQRFEFTSQGNMSLKSCGVHPIYKHEKNAKDNLHEYVDVNSEPPMKKLKIQ